MKTPLHSITAEIDCLRLFTTKLANDINSISNVAPTQETASIQPLLKQYFNNSYSVYDHLDGMTQFLLMAINRSQDFVKAKSGVAIKPSLETIDMMQCTELVKKIMDNQSNGRQVIIHPIDTLQLCPHVITDRQFFLDNLLCLVSNACKYSDVGSVVDVNIRLVSDATFFDTSSDPSFESIPIDSPTAKKKVLVSVEDNGIGISADDQNNLFEPFKQAQRRTGGTGLGLYSLKKRIQALHGDCGVTSCKDNKQGSVFLFSFPYRPDTQHLMLISSATAIMPPTFINYAEMTPILKVAGQDTSTSTRPLPDVVVVPNESPKIPKLRILLTDDSASILKVTSRFLRMNGHEVTTAENGSQTIKQINYDELMFDVLVTDLQMPVCKPSVLYAV